jgi:Tol biopolymer transport system component
VNSHGVLSIWFLWHSGARPVGIAERQLTASFGPLVLEAAISPDGSSLAYADKAGLYAKIIDTGEVHQLPWPRDVRIYQIVWFPNNRDLLISAMPGLGIRTGLWTVSVFGGPPKLIREDVRDLSISWDGSRIAFVPNALDSLWVMNSAGENAKKVLSAADGYIFQFPAWYPGDKALLYSSISQQTGNNSFKSFDLETGQPGLFSTAGDAGWEFLVLRDGRMLSLGGQPQVDGVYEIKADLRSARPVGEARLIRDWPANYIYRPTASADGKRMAFLKRVSEQTLFIADIKYSGKRLENVRRFVRNGTLNIARGWTPDGSAVVFVRDRGGSYEISRQRLDSETPEPLVISQERPRSARFTPDGKWLLYLLQKQNGDVKSDADAVFRRVGAVGLE